MDIRQQLANSLEQSVRDLAGQEIEAQVVISSDLSKGDWSTNVAMVAFGKIKNNKSNLKSSMELAKEIAEHLKLEIRDQSFVDRIEVAAPGFINFWLSEAQVIAGFEGVLSFGKSSAPRKSEVILEFGDLNPFKEPHIGHLRNLALGESLARLMERQGNKVIRANYEGDVGMHVAKALWGIKNHESGIMNLDKGTLEDKVKHLGKAYSVGAKSYEEDDSAKQNIISINKKIYQKDSEIVRIWQKGRQISLDYFEELYKKLGIKYHTYYFESVTAPVGLKIVNENVGKVFEKHEGAIIFRGEKVGLHTRVFVTKEEYATYEGKDLALAVLKDQDFPNTDKSIIMTANEQIEYFKVMFAALNLIDKKIADKSSHLSFGFVNLKEGKMSSRTGDVIPAFWLLDEIKKRLKNGFKEVENDVLEQLSVGAVKWAMLKFSRESDISFSIDESIQIEGNSGPYMQYSYARTQSLIDKSSRTSSEAKLRENLEPELLALARVICQFEIVIKTACDTFSPNILSNYLYNLAQKFNQFYEKEKIIGSAKEEEKMILVNAVGEVLKNGLHLLGINAPKKI